MGKRTTRVAIVLVLAFSFIPACAQDRGGLTTRPADSLDAEKVRIWLSLERTATCRVTATIVDSRRDTVRHLFSELMRPGYYNFFWDKRNDSGQFVDTGDYRYIYKDCQGTKGGRLRIDYKRWERSCRLITDRFSDSSIIDLEFLEDSIVATLTFENIRGKVVDQPVADSVMTRGLHHFRWQPDKRVPSGNYTVKLYAGEFVTAEKIRFRRR